MAKPRQSLAQTLGDSVVKKFIADPDSTQSTQAIAIHTIKLPPTQPRRFFDSEKMEQLVQSVREHGILEPLLVRPLPGGEYELVAGERRLRAAQYLNLPDVPVVIKDFDDQQALEVSLLENLQREDLNPVEETEGLLQLMAIDLNLPQADVISLLHQSYNAKQRGQELNGNVTIQLQKVDEILTTIGRFNAESFRSNRLPLLNLPSDVLEVLRQGKLEYTKARAIARVKDDAQRQALLTDVMEQHLSLVQIKQRIKEFAVAPEPKPPTIGDRLLQISKKLKEKDVIDDPKKQKRVEKLLQELEAIANGD
jgi:ParB family transcriptional regulator, chromosome partitioning protein